MNYDEISLWLKLSRANGVGPVTMRRLLARFGSLENIAGACCEGLKCVDGIGDKTALSILRSFELEDVESEIEKCQSNGIKILTITSPEYPQTLLTTDYAPPILYSKGEIFPIPKPIAIVGSRRCTLYGAEQAKLIGATLASWGFSIISGMARGVDSEAHKGAIIAGGKTLAVMGTGLLKIYPPENRKLFEEICEKGACISQFPPDTEPRPENFVPRNKIIAGISLGTLVVEASPSSGAMSTAEFAINLERKIFALPGRVDSMLSRGPNQLIRAGACLVTGAADIANELEGVLGKFDTINHNETKDIKQQTLFDYNPTETIILKTLKNTPLHPDDIINQTGLSVAEVNSSLVRLQISGRVKRLPGNIFSLKK